MYYLLYYFLELIFKYVVLQNNNLNQFFMSKTTTQVLADLRHNLNLLEAINKGSGGNVRFDNSKALEELNNNLKRKITSVNKSNGQLRGIAERKGKQVLRLKSENDKLLELVDSLKQEIELQGFLGLYENALEENVRLQVDNQALREYLHGQPASVDSGVKSAKEKAIDLETEAVNVFNQRFRMGEEVYFKDINGKMKLGNIEKEAILDGGLIACVKIKSYPVRINCVNIYKI